MTRCRGGCCSSHATGSVDVVSVKTVYEGEISTARHEEAE